MYPSHNAMYMHAYLGDVNPPSLSSFEGKDAITSSPLRNASMLTILFSPSSSELSELSSKKEWQK